MDIEKGDLLMTCTLSYVFTSKYMTEEQKHKIEEASFLNWEAKETRDLIKYFKVKK